MPQESFAKVAKRRMYGVLFIVIVVAFVSLSIAIYNKVFTKTVDITLRANNIGNQLLIDSDVKVRGLIVGSVRDITVKGDVSVVSISLEPDKVNLIPRTVTAQVLPKTLFGEQYIALGLPANSSGVPHIADGDVISQNVTKGALEAQTVLDNLYPVLTAVRPAELNATLTALATALQGRGKQLGETLVNLDDYLKAINPHTKQLVQDLKKLGQVALEYDDVAPDIFGALSNLQTSVRTVASKQQAIDNLFTTGTQAASVLQGFLSDNKQRLINVSGQSAKIYPLLAEYSPSFTCLFAGVNKLADQVNKTIYDSTIHLGVTLDATNQGKYVPGEQPRYVTGYGPNCFGLPDNPQPVVDGKFQIPDKYKCLNDGAALTTDPCGKSPSAAGNTALNSQQENALVNSLIAQQLGTTPKNVPDAATILAAPMLRGNNVEIK